MWSGWPIPASVNVPAIGVVVDPETSQYRGLDELKTGFSDIGSTERERVITYCGGRIAASSTAFALHLIGIDNVAVYEGSRSEWGNDPDIPMETG